MRGQSGGRGIAGLGWADLGLPLPEPSGLTPEAAFMVFPVTFLPALQLLPDQPAGRAKP